MYSGSSGAVYGDGRFGQIWGKGSKILAGDVITVTVDVESGTIQWAINGILQFKYVSSKLKDNSINWVPYIWMAANVRVQWIE